MARQTRLPGMEEKNFKAVNKAAEAYVRERDARQAQTLVEKEAKTDLIAAMKEARIKIYVDHDAVPPLLVALKPRDTTPDVKVSEYHDDDEEEEEEEIVEDREARQAKPVGDDTMKKPSPANRKLETGREKMAKAREGKKKAPASKASGGKKASERIADLAVPDETHGAEAE